jgi:hypothetical protein
MVSSRLVELVENVHALPYGRPSDRSVEGMLRERRGTCSTKHLHLWRELARRFPESEPQLVHRVYRVGRAAAARLFGATAAAAVPPGGLVDVHRYLTLRLDGTRLVIDVTFPGPPWDGRSSMPLSCGDGEDHVAGADPDADKRRLEQAYCDATVREPFIAALASRGASRATASDGS